MSRFPRLRRRPDHWSDPHERARIRAAEQLDGPIGHVESTWLEAHLADCPACAAIAAEYEADRAALRALRAEVPTPPRDLWARTAAAIETESAARGFSSGRSAPVRRSRLPLGALSAIAVIVLVVGVSATSGGLFRLSGPLQGNPIAGATDASSPGIAVASVEAPPPSPFAVDAGNVAYIRRGPDGSLYRSTPIRQVCPSQSDASCAAIPEPSPKKLSLSAAPRTIISAPGDKQAVAVGSASAGGDQIVVVALPSDTSPDASATPAPTPVMTASPADTPSVAPSDTPQPTSTVGGNTGTATPPATGSAPASATPTDSQQPSSSPVSPTPTIAAGLAIASGVSVVGDSAAFSADGTWFAFTARPADGSGGPDVYVWHVGDQTARKLTTDGASVFASWAGDMIVESRPADLPTSGHVDPTSVIADPVTGTVSDQAGAVWRPVVAPDGSRAVAWVGSVARGQDQNTWQPASGRLALVSWPHPDGSVSSDKLTVVADGPLAEYDVRWDETGGWFGLWVADDAGAQVGRLSLFHVDPQTGELSRPKGAPTDETAMAGFSIGKGRLAWATPPGTDGEGSRIQVVAWRDGSVGSVETVPGEDLVVVR